MKRYADTVVAALILALVFCLAGAAGAAEEPAPPKEAPAEQEEPPTVEIPPEQQELIGVMRAEVSLKPFTRTVRTVGRVEYDERMLATVNTKIEGWIERLHVDYTGRYVKRGELLAEIYSPEFIATQQEYLNALRWARNARGDGSNRLGEMLARDAEALVAAARQRLRLWDITDEQIGELEAAGEPVRTFRLYSPVNGFVTEKMAVQGMKVMAGDKLFDVADLSTVWIIADVYESELALVATGQKAKISLSSLPGSVFSSKITYIYPVLSGPTRTAKVRFEVPNAGTRLKPEMFANVEIGLDLGKRLAIPENAVIDTGKRHVVYVERSEGYFEPREVELGIRGEGIREVIAGLKQGDRVVSSATFLVDSEAQLRGIRPLGDSRR